MCLGDKHFKCKGINNYLPGNIFFDENFRKVSQFD